MSRVERTTFGMTESEERELIEEATERLNNPEPPKNLNRIQKLAYQQLLAEAPDQISRNIVTHCFRVHNLDGETLRIFMKDQREQWRKK